MMPQEMMQELSRRIVEAARMAVALHLEQQAAGEGIEANQGLYAESAGGAGWMRSTEGRQPSEDARDGRSPNAGREAA